VAALGGAARATSTATAGIQAAQQVGALVAGIARDGLDATLRDADLGHLVGQDRFHVVEGLLEIILRDVGAGSEAEAANQAACDVLEDLFDPDAVTYVDLAAVEIDRERVGEIERRALRPPPRSLQRQPLARQPLDRSHERCRHLGSRRGTSVVPGDPAGPGRGVHGA